MNEKIPITDDMPQDLKDAIDFLNHNHYTKRKEPDRHLLDGISRQGNFMNDSESDNVEEEEELIEIEDNLSEEDISEESVEDLENLFK